jgi:predicted phosphodiesterase
VRLVLASDTHERHGEIEVPDGDVFIHAGDFTMVGDLQRVAAFGAWVRGLPHRKKIVVAGNHDRTFEHSLAAALRKLGDGRDGLVYLQDSGVAIEGIAFWGSPWQPWFYDWAFNLRRGPMIAAKWSLIPETTDVLITHGPPMGILDFVHNEHVGCADLRERVKIVRPKVHVFGHIHDGSGIATEEGTVFVNASICDEEYEPTNPCRVVDF